MTQNSTSHNGQTKRLAAIDVGTNSIRLIVAEATSDGQYRVVDDEKVVARLGRGMSDSGELSADAVERATLAIGRLKEIAEGHRVDALRAIATCAVREAANGTAFVDLVREQAGVALEVISAEEEARLAYRSVSHAFDLSNLTVATADIGGGSTEVIISTNGVFEQVLTLQLGAVRLTEMFGTADLITPDAYKELRQFVRRSLKDAIGKPSSVPHLLIGTGGTFTTLAAISMQQAAADRQGELLPYNVRGYELQRADVKHVLDRLCKVPLRERVRIPGLNPDRADIIVAGIVIVDGVLRRLGVNSVRVHDQGIRDGLLIAMIDQIFPSARRSAVRQIDRVRNARRFARACNYERHHSEHVTRLALAIFDQVVREDIAHDTEEWATPQCREMLEAAAVLHDIGYYINYAKHHKHSYHLIVHSDLPGFTHREIDIVANVARYHRRADPKSRHPNFSKLTKADQRIVKCLAAILRVADGLDRDHTGKVSGVSVQAHDECVQFEIEAAEDPQVAMWGAERKSGLFEKIFGCNVRFSWSEPIAHISATQRATGRST